MTWVRRQQAAAKHTCPTPRGEGTPGDLWRCDGCSKLWRLGPVCDSCDRYNSNDAHGGQCVISDPEGNHTKWRPATTIQRLRYWAQGHKLRVGGYQPTDDLDYELPPPAAGPPPVAHKAPPDLSWIQTETISGSGKRSGPHPLDPPRQTGTRWLYSEPENTRQA